MQEPEIFEQPVANTRDPEAHAAGDDNGTYGGGTLYSNGVGATAVDDDTSEDYHDFVYPEGWSFLPCFLLVKMKRGRSSDTAMDL
jgi:hypothetical protein